MTIPGLALFYGGLVRTKNVLGTIMQSFIMVGLITIQWVLFGYSLAFSTGSSFLGGLQWLGLNGVGLTPNPDYARHRGRRTYGTRPQPAQRKRLRLFCGIRRIT